MPDTPEELRLREFYSSQQKQNTDIGDKADSTHTHVASDVTDFDTEVANNSAVTANTAKNSYPSADATKLAGIEALAEVNNISDTNATDLTDGGETSLHTHSQPYIKLSKSATQAVTPAYTGRQQSINWDSQIHTDSEFTHSTSSSNTRVGVVTGGLYSLRFAVKFYNPGLYSMNLATGYLVNAIPVVSKTGGEQRQFVSGITGDLGCVYYNEITLSASDYIQAYVIWDYISASSAMSFKTSECILIMTKIG
jgi:hypothetical protein